MLKNCELGIEGLLLRVYGAVIIALKKLGLRGISMMSGKGDKVLKVQVFQGKNLDVIKEEKDIKLLIPVRLLDGDIDINDYMFIRRVLSEILETETITRVEFEESFVKNKCNVLLKHAINDVIMMVRLHSVEERRRLNNLAENISKIFEFPTIELLKDLNIKPSLVVSGGPSLELSLEEIKKFQADFLIISVSAAAKKLLENDIVPDIIVYYDQSIKQYEVYFKDLPYLKKTFVVVHPFLDPSFFEKRQNFLLFYPKTFQRFLGIDFYSCFSYIPFLQSGLSVAHTAVFLAEYINPKTPLILVAQDLSMDEAGRMYPNGVRKDNKVNVDVNRTLQAKGISGELRPTTWDYWIFLKYFEMLGRYLRKKDMMIFNATKEGAYIKNFVHVKTLYSSILRRIMRVYSDVNKNPFKEKMLSGYTRLSQEIKVKSERLFLESIECLKNKIKKVSDEISEEIEEILERLLRES